MIRAVSSRPFIDVPNLLDAVIFNYIIGNCDAHGKNFSILYNDNFTYRHLTPLYDLVSTTYYPDHATQMAMKIGSVSDINKVTPEDFEKMATTIDISPSLTKKRVGDLSRTIAVAIPFVTESVKNSSKIAESITRRNNEIFNIFS